MSNKPAYTPGPWVVTHIDTRDDLRVRAPTLESLETILAVWRRGALTRDEDIANLRLAAAAPEMYELLKDMDIDNCMLAQTIRSTRRIGDLRERIDAIIAKVEGK